MKKTHNYPFIFCIFIAILVAAAIKNFSCFKQLKAKAVGLGIVYWTYSPEDTPNVYATPSAEINIPRSPSDNFNLREFNCGPLSFYLPHAEKVKISRFDEDDSVCVLSGNLLVHAQTILPDLLYEMRKGMESGNEVYALVFDQLTLSSRFEFHRALFETTPKSVSIGSSLKDIAQTNILLVMKALTIPSESHGGFILTLGNVRGLQIGDPSKGDNHILVNLYPDSTTHYQLGLLGFNQKMINEMLSTIKFHTD